MGSRRAEPAPSARRRATPFADLLRSDIVLLTTALALSLVGALLVRSATQAQAGSTTSVKHLVNLVVGLVMAGLLVRLDRHTLRALAPLAYGLSVAALVLVLTPLYCGEEFGWTSYLRLRLMPHRPWASTLLTGLIWAVWHYPLAFLGYIEFSHVLLGLAVWTASFVLQEILLTWLRLRSGTVWTSLNVLTPASRRRRCRSTSSEFMK